MMEIDTFSEEGEIVESSDLKANSTDRSHATKIDRYTRGSTSTSKSPSIDGRERDRSRSPFRERSRSPYRHSDQPRGEKRRRDDPRDRFDTRRFPVRYEDGRRNLTSYADIDNGDPVPPSTRPRGRDSHYQRPTSGRDEYRSRRSPEYRPHNKDRSSRYGRDHKYGRNRKEAYPNKERSDRNSYAERLKSPEGHLNEATDVKVNGPQKDAKVAPTTESHPDNNGIAIEAPQEPPVDIEPAIEDDADFEAKRAEKRRRREAIRARAAASQQPLLVQALTGDTSTSGAPSPVTTSADRSDQSVSPTVGSPDVIMQDTSVPNSPAPFDISKDGSSEAFGSPEQFDNGADEPSAADYDPTKDMEDDRLRAEQKQSDLPASAYDETNPEQRQVLVPIVEPQQAQPAKKPKKEFDMFASDEEEEDEEPGEENKAATITVGQELDQNLLDNWDDDQGYYRIIHKEKIGGRYIIEKVLGKGVFAAVVRAKIEGTTDTVAIKIVRRNDMMHKAGLKEITILKTLRDDDPDDKAHVVRLKTSFEHKKHLCMVFEDLDMNLRDLLKEVGANRGLSLGAVRAYARQIFQGLRLMKKCHIVHADLKPDNILVSKDRKVLKICDLGSAVDERDNNELTPYLVSRFYRAPEIILGKKVDYAIDMWSIGCTLYELWTGKILFTGGTNNQMLKSMMECRGKFTNKTIKNFANSHQHFNMETMEFYSIETNPFNKVVGRWIAQPSKPSKDLKTRVVEAAKDMKDPPSRTELHQFADLLEKCLDLKPEKRIDPSTALKHEFLISPGRPVPTTKSTPFAPRR